MKPPLEQNYYELLEVPRDATVAELDRAYERAKAFYGVGSIAVYSLTTPEELKHVQDRIDEAYLILSDDSARAEYDARIGPPSPDERPLHREVRLAREKEAAKEAETRARVEAEARNKSDAEAKVKSDAEAKAKSDAEAKVKSDAEAKAKSDAEAKAKSDAEAKEVKPKSDADVKEAEAKSDAEVKEVPPAEVPPEAPAPVAEAPAVMAPAVPIAEALFDPPTAPSPLPVVEPIPLPVVAVAAPVPSIPKVPTPPPLPTPLPAAKEVQPDPPAPPPLVASPADPPPPLPQPALVVVETPPPAAPVVVASLPPRLPVPVTEVRIDLTPRPEERREPRYEAGPPAPPPMEAPEPMPRPAPSLRREPKAPDRTTPKVAEIPSDAVFNGEYLRKLRETYGLSVQELSDRTKIGKSHLENIEADRYGSLPPLVYLRGFLMSYARELKLDPVRVSKSYLEQQQARDGTKAKS